MKSMKTLKRKGKGEGVQLTGKTVKKGSVKLGESGRGGIQESPGILLGGNPLKQERARMCKVQMGIKVRAWVEAQRGQGKKERKIKASGRDHGEGGIGLNTLRENAPPESLSGNRQTIKANRKKEREGSLQTV